MIDQVHPHIECFQDWNQTRKMFVRVWGILVPGLFCFVFPRLLKSCAVCSLWVSSGGGSGAGSASIGASAVPEGRTGASRSGVVWPQTRCAPSSPQPRPALPAVGIHAPTGQAFARAKGGQTDPITSGMLHELQEPLRPAPPPPPLAHPAVFWSRLPLAQHFVQLPGVHQRGWILEARAPACAVTRLWCNQDFFELCACEFSTLWCSHGIKAAGSTAIKVADTSTFCLIWDQKTLSGFLFTEWEDSVMLLTLTKKM